MQDLPDGEIRKEAKPILILSVAESWPEKCISLVNSQPCCQSIYYPGSGWICMSRTFNPLFAAANQKKVSASNNNGG